VIILDTNVLSEAIKPAPSDAVLRWLAAQAPHEVFATSITQAEILYGVELLPAGKRRDRMAAAVDKIFTEDLKTPILTFDEYAARAYAKLAAARQASGRPIAQSDGMIAAIALTHRGAVATRDIGGFEGCGIQLINPWSA